MTRPQVGCPPFDKTDNQSIAAHQGLDKIVNEPVPQGHIDVNHVSGRKRSESRTQREGLHCYQRKVITTIEAIDIGNGSDWNC